MSRRKTAFIIAAVLLIGILGVNAEIGRLYIVDSPSLIRPGKTEKIVFFSPHAGEGSLALADPSGNPVSIIYGGFEASQGENSLTWNGLDRDMSPVKPGQYVLNVNVDGETASQGILLGEPAPQITQLMFNDARIVPGKGWGLSARVNMPGELIVVFHVADLVYEIYHDKVEEGAVSLSWDGLIEGKEPPPGRHTMSVVFFDETGFPANQQHIMLEVTDRPTPEPTPAVTPEVTAAPTPEARHYTVPTAQEVPDELLGSSFWKLPVGEWNEEAIWKVMLQPITVLWGEDQRETYKLRAAKDDSLKRENIIGEITYESQGVNVIEQSDDGWSLVEAYNSSYGPDNRTRRGYGDTDDLIRGYVRTSVLKTITPRDDYAILIDKLKQRLYVFREGKLFTELIISTGVPTRQQPWNETPSGEFLMVSRVGEFYAGNLVCRMAMRINGGSLIHEVPYIVNEKTGYWDYSSQEAQLGKKASHGCIRVQRVNNADGINMTWLWNNIKTNTKVLVWDDFPGRYYEYPENDLALFYNPQGGKYYHLDRNCSSIKDRFLPLPGEMRYDELDSDAFRKLAPCPYCNPPLKISEIDRINRDNGF